MNFLPLSNFIRNFSVLILVLFAAVSTAVVNAQSVTNIDVGSTVLQTGVQRLGMNVGAHDFYDSGQLTKNLTFRNPGFEPQMYQSTVRCAFGTALTCTDDDAWGAWPANFWQGASYEVVYGAAKGRTGFITGNTAPINTVIGVVLAFDSAGPAPGVGDYLVLRKAISGNPTVGWWTNITGNATLTPETSDLPPNTAGVQCLRVSVHGANSQATVSSYFDGTAGLSFIQLKGFFQLSFKAKGTEGQRIMQVQVFRSGEASFLGPQTINLSNDWQTFDLPFAANENGSYVGSVNVVFTAPGPTGFLLDDVSVTQTNSSAANPTAYRDSVLDALRTYRPGSLRYWDSQLGESLDNWITPPFGRKPTGFSAWSTGVNDVSVGLNEFLQLCQTLNADAWIVVPVVFSTTEASNLIEFLSGPPTSPYGSKRAALGQVNPWTSVIPKIHLELGNETWSSVLRGGNMEYSDAYGAYSNDIFGAMRANPNYVPNRYDLVLGGQEVWLGRNQLIMANANMEDTLAIAGYMYANVDNFANNEELFGPLFAEPEEDNAPNGFVGQNNVLTPNLAVYEANLSTESGAITQNQAALNQLTPSLGAGLAMADHMLLMIKNSGIHPIHLWQLGQYDYSLPGGNTVPLFGTVVDMGNTNRKRPQFLAAVLANKAINGNMIETTQSGANPTWNQPLMNGQQYSGAHYIQSYAFANGASRSLALFNLHRTDPLQVTFSDVNAPSGTVQVFQLHSANITDTNEQALNVGIVPSQLSNFDPTVPYTLPPYSMTVLVWSQTASGISVSVSPTTSTLSPGGAAQLTATVKNTSNQGVQWSLSPNVGSISASGLYSAPANFTAPSSIVASATSVADPSQSGSASIFLAPYPIVTVQPNNPTLNASQSVQFGSTVQNSNNPAVTWSVSPPIGTISAAGVYTAPALIVVSTAVTVTATSVANPGFSGSATLTLAPSVSANAQTGGTTLAPFAVNCGGPAYTDSKGLAWQADIGYAGGAPTKVTSPIAGTSDQNLYQSQRWGNMVYTFAVPNGTYQLTFKFAELFWGSPGQRVFNVLVNGQTVVSNFDIVQAAGGPLQAVSTSVTVPVANNQLVISFQGIVDNPAINAIELVQTASPVIVSPGSATLTAGQTQQLSATGGSSAAYTWSLSPNLGSVTSNGLYTAPAVVNSQQTVLVSVASKQGTSSTAQAQINLLPPGTASQVAIQCGGAGYQDPSGLTWAADNSFTGGVADLEPLPIAGTSTPQLYQSNRWGAFSYNLALLNGTYKVTLKFAELFWSGAGQRVFNVTANGQTLLQNFDIVAAAGAAFTAVDRSFTVSVTNGAINLQFTPTIDNALVSAIEVTTQ